MAMVVLAVLLNERLDDLRGQVAFPNQPVGRDAGMDDRAGASMPRLRLCTYRMSMAQPILYVAQDSTTSCTVIFRNVSEQLPCI